LQWSEKVIKLRRSLDLLLRAGEN